MGLGCGGRESWGRSFGHGDQRGVCWGIPRLHSERAEVYEPGAVLSLGAWVESGLGFQAPAAWCPRWWRWRTRGRADGSGCRRGPVGCDAKESAFACVFGERVLRSV